METTTWINNCRNIKDAIDNMLLELDNCKDETQKALLDEVLLEMDVLVRVL